MESSTGLTLTAWAPRLAGAAVVLLQSLFSLNARAADPVPAATNQPSAADQKVIRRIQCLDHVRKLSGAITLYAFDHDGNYPPDLGTLAQGPEVELSLFVCPSAANALPEHWQALGPKEKAAWVNAHTDYVYRGAGAKAGTLAGTAPLLYDKDDDHDGTGVCVLFVDGDVALLTPPELRQKFGPKAGTERTTTRVAPAPGAPPSIPLITMDQAKALVAQAEIRQLKSALNVFEVDNARFPTTQEGLSALVAKPANLPQWHQAIDRLPVDPWGRPYTYVCPGLGGADFTITSNGPDGRPGTADDVK